MIMQERKLHPEDLFLARKTLIELRDPMQRSRMQEAATRVPQIVEVWNKDRWPWHNDVPSGRMYVFGGLFISKEEDVFDQRYDEMLAWFESEIDRVERELVRFYLNHQPVVELHVIPVSRNRLRLTEVVRALALIAPLMLMFSGAWHILYAGHQRPFAYIGAALLIAGTVLLFVMLAIRRQLTAQSIRAELERSTQGGSYAR